MRKLAALIFLVFAGVPAFAACGGVTGTSIPASTSIPGSTTPLPAVTSPSPATPTPEQAAAESPATVLPPLTNDGDDSKVELSDPPADLSIPFKTVDVGGSLEFISPFGVIRHSRDAGHGHGGIDFPLSGNDPIYAVADGTILAAEVSSDGTGGSDVKLLISGSGGEGWGFIYEHVALERGIAPGGAVAKGQVIARNALATDRRDNNPSSPICSTSTISTATRGAGSTT